jgi:hypothetical protein
MENGSGGFLADLTFVGGNFGYVIISMLTFLLMLVKADSLPM